MSSRIRNEVVDFIRFSFLTREHEQSKHTYKAMIDEKKFG